MPCDLNPEDKWLIRKLCRARGIPQTSSSPVASAPPRGRRALLGSLGHQLGEFYWEAALGTYLQAWEMLPCRIKTPGMDFR